MECPNDKNPFPSYNTVKNQIMKYDQIVSKIERESGNLTLSSNGWMVLLNKNSAIMINSIITCVLLVESNIAILSIAGQISKTNMSISSKSDKYMAKSTTNIKSNLRSDSHDLNEEYYMKDDEDTEDNQISVAFSSIICSARLGCNFIYFGFWSLSSWI